MSAAEGDQLFLDAARDPDDYLTRMALADWIEEEKGNEEAALAMRWCANCDVLMRWPLFLREASNRWDFPAKRNLNWRKGRHVLPLALRVQVQEGFPSIPFPFLSKSRGILACFTELGKILKTKERKIIEVLETGLIVPWRKQIDLSHRGDDR